MTEKNFVMVEWVDSRQPTASWRRVSDIDYLCECRVTSVGFLLRDDKRAKVLAASIADEGDELQATGIFVIPTAAVLSQVTLTPTSSPNPPQTPGSKT